MGRRHSALWQVEPPYTGRCQARLPEPRAHTARPSPACPVARPPVLCPARSDCPRGHIVHTNHLLFLLFDASYRITTAAMLTGPTYSNIPLRYLTPMMYLHYIGLKIGQLACFILAVYIHPLVHYANNLLKTNKPVCFSLARRDKTAIS